MTPYPSSSDLHDDVFAANHDAKDLSPTLSGLTSNGTRYKESTYLSFLFFFFPVICEKKQLSLDVNT